MKVQIHESAHSGCARRAGYTNFRDRIEVEAFDGEHCVFCGQTFGTFVPQPEAAVKQMYIYETASPAAENVTRRYLVTYKHPKHESTPYDGDIDDFIKETEAAGGEALVIVGERLYMTQTFIRAKLNYDGTEPDRQREDVPLVHSGRFALTGVTRMPSARRRQATPRTITIEMPAGVSDQPEVGRRYRVYDRTGRTDPVVVERVEKFGALCSDGMWRPLSREKGCHWQALPA